MPRANNAIGAMTDDEVIAGFRYALTRLRVRDDGTLAPVPSDAELDTLLAFIDAASTLADHDHPDDLRMALVGMIAADATEAVRTGLLLWIGEALLGAAGHREAVKRLMVARARLLSENLSAQAD
jgi:hypothetical protein